MWEQLGRCHVCTVIGKCHVSMHSSNKLQARYTDEVQTRCANKVQARYTEKVQARCANEVQARYTDEVQTRCANKVQARYTDEVQARYTDEVQARCADEVQARCANKMQARCTDEVQAKCVDVLPRTFFLRNVCSLVMTAIICVIRVTDVDGGEKSCRNKNICINCLVNIGAISLTTVNKPSSCISETVKSASLFMFLLTFS